SFYEVVGGPVVWSACFGMPSLSCGTEHTQLHVLSQANQQGSTSFPTGLAAPAGRKQSHVRRGGESNGTCSCLIPCSRLNKPRPTRRSTRLARRRSHVVDETWIIAVPNQPPTNNRFHAEESREELKSLPVLLLKPPHLLGRLDVIQCDGTAVVLATPAP